jgi:hypothetical protein
MDNQKLSKKEQYLLKREQKEKERLGRIRQKKLRKIIILSLSTLLVIGGTFLLLKSEPEESEKGEKSKITVFYSPTCACCAEYSPYLRRNGFLVEEIKTQDMLSLKEKYQIPSEMEACHTSVSGDYFVEGHVPVDAIKKLLAEKPEIDGIALPGMPQGSPGMPGFKVGKWTIYSLFNGQPSEFMLF